MKKKLKMASYFVLVLLSLVFTYASPILGGIGGGSNGLNVKIKSVDWSKGIVTLVWNQYPGADGYCYIIGSGTPTVSECKNVSTTKIGTQLGINIPISKVNGREFYVGVIDHGSEVVMLDKIVGDSIRLIKTLNSSRGIYETKSGIDYDGDGTIEMCDENIGRDKNKCVSVLSDGKYYLKAGVDYDGDGNKNEGCNETISGLNKSNCLSTVTSWNSLYDRYWNRDIERTYTYNNVRADRGGGGVIAARCPSGYFVRNVSAYYKMNNSRRYNRNVMHTLSSWNGTSRLSRNVSPSYTNSRCTNRSNYRSRGASSNYLNTLNWSNSNTKVDGVMYSVGTYGNSCRSNGWTRGAPGRSISSIISSSRLSNDIKFGGSTTRTSRTNRGRYDNLRLTVTCSWKGLY